MHPMTRPTKTRLNLPNATLVNALITALALGSFGAAGAAGLTKGAVKKIATEVVKKQASTLAVASAATANTATTAANSSALNGLPAAAYLDRVAYLTVANATVPSGSVPTPVAGPLSLTVPAGVSLVEVSGIGNFNTASPAVKLWIADDATCSSTNSGFNAPSFAAVPSSGTTSATNQIVFAVTPGVHSYLLCALSGAGTGSVNDSLLARTVALGASGGTTLRQPSRAGGEAGHGTH
jgi:hypothetical protein